MKKYAVITKDVENVTVTELETIVHNFTQYDCSIATVFEKKCILYFRELAKAVNTKDYEIVLNCNYAHRKTQNNAVTEYRLAVYDRMIHVYCKKNKCSICCSIAEKNKQVFADRFEQLQIVTDNKKTAYRNNVNYDELAQLIKDIIAVYKLTATTDTETEQ